MGFSYRIIGLVLASLLVGCAAGPDYKRPAAPDINGYAPNEAITQPTNSVEVLVGASQRFNTTADIPFDWWKLFQSPQLNALIERTLKANPNIEAAQAALRQAHENVIAQQGFFYPSVSVNYSPSRNKLAGNMGGNSPGLQQNGDSIQSTPDSPAYYN